jgi:hypothetical protein
MFQEGQTVDGYELVRDLGHGNHRCGSFGVATWHVCDASARDCVMRRQRTFVSDDYGGETDYWERVAPLRARLERLPTLPELPGIAPWLAYRNDMRARRVVLIRGYYATKFAQCFPAAITADAEGRPNPDFVTAFREIARGIDALDEILGEALDLSLHLDNLFMEETHAFLADFGVRALARAIDEWDYGPRSFAPGSVENPMTYLDEGYLPRSTPIADAQFLLAATYFQARTGRPIFPVDTSSNILVRLQSLDEQCKAYLQGARLNLDLIPTRPERDAIAKALAVNPKQRFSSCTEFMNSVQ